ncbi:MAG TPA: hypothetical protein VMT90_00675 [Dehalococcoidia bacterium]|jgi:hypothetical protein|nr:hypothetical protein [Dehalococcoidia bacterium]
MRKLPIRLIPLVLVLAAIIGDPIPAARAHNMTPVPGAYQYTCVNGGTSVVTTQYNNRGPTNKNWAITFTLSLDGGGDRYQDAWFDSTVWDDATNADWHFQHSNYDWIIPGEAQFSSTISPHVGSTFDMLTTVNNQDFFSQCFYLQADAGYY